jgi:hypothetical protein
LYFQSILAGEDNPLLSPPQFIGHPILVGDWIHDYLDDLALPWLIGVLLFAENIVMIRQVNSEH